MNNHSELVREKLIEELESDIKFYKENAHMMGESFSEYMIRIGYSKNTLKNLGAE
jgi:hypothetical protein